MPNPAESLVGKPLTFGVGAKKRIIGEVTRAEVRGDSVFFAALVTDREVADLLGIDLGEIEAKV